MKKNLNKKFLKKNILLQQNLERFLTWRKKKTCSAYTIQTLKKSSPFVLTNGDNTHLLRKLKKTIFGSKQRGVSHLRVNAKSQKLYRPIEFKSWSQFLNQKFFSDFFPHKKPFIHFWIFPLLGGCFLSLLTLNRTPSTLMKFNNLSTLGFPFFSVNEVNVNLEDIKKNSQSTKLLNNILFNNQHQKLAVMKSSLETSNEQLFNLSTEKQFAKQNLFFSASYSKNLNKLGPIQTLSTDSLPIELKNLCLFYLNLTNQELKHSSKKFDYNNYSKFYLEQTLQKTLSLQQPIQFHWIWAGPSLKINVGMNQLEKSKLLESLNIERFPQKIKKNNFVLENSNFSSSCYRTSAHWCSPLDSPYVIDQSSQIPHLSYLQAAHLLDEWINKLELNSILRQFPETGTTASNNINKFAKWVKNDLKMTQNSSLIELCEKVYALENSLLMCSSQKNNLTYHFSMLLNKIIENKKNLKELFSQSSLDTFVVIKSNLNNQQTNPIQNSQDFRNVYPTKEQNSKTIYYKNLLEKIQNQYRYHLMKIWGVRHLRANAKANEQFHFSGKGGSNLRANARPDRRFRFSGRLENDFSKIYADNDFSNIKNSFSKNTGKSLNPIQDRAESHSSLKNSKFQSNFNNKNLNNLNQHSKSNNLLEDKLKKIFNFTIFFKINNHKILLKNKTVSLLTRLQSIHRLKLALTNSKLLNPKFNSTNSSLDPNNSVLNIQLVLLNADKEFQPISLKTLDSKLKRLTYELMLLQHWKKIFPETFSLRNLNDQYLDNMTAKQVVKYEQSAKQVVKYEQLKKNDSLTLTNNLVNQQDLVNKTNKQINSCYGKADSFETNYDFIGKNSSQELVFFTHKLVKEINLYRQLQKVFQKLVELPFSSSPDSLNKNTTNKILKYKTPFLFSDIKTSTISVSKNKSNLFLTDTTSQFVKTDWKLDPKYWHEMPLSLLDLSSKQNNLASVLIFDKQPRYVSNLLANSRLIHPNLEKKRTSTKKTNENINLVTFLLNKNRKQDLPILNLTSLQNLNVYLNKHQWSPDERSSQNFQKVKKFLVLKKFSALTNPNIYLLRPFESLNLLGSEHHFQQFKLKSKVKTKFLPFCFAKSIHCVRSSIFEKRKAEKIFRSYFSVKSLERQENSLLNTPSDIPLVNGTKFLIKKRSLNPVLSTRQQVVKYEQLSQPADAYEQLLRKLKKIVKTKKVFFKKNKDWIYFNWLDNGNFKDKELLEKFKNHSNVGQNTFIQSNIYHLLKSSNKITNKKLEKNSLKLSSLETRTLLKKLAGAIKFQKKSSFSTTDTEKKRLDKKKALQKKRRLKKLKLENRRRKKRKRFYPRPYYLRFQLYYSFLQKRHPHYFQKPLKDIFDSNTEKQNSFALRKKIKPSLMTTSNLLQSKLSKNNSDSNMFKEKIYRQKKQKWGNVASNLFLSEKFSLKKSRLNWTTPTYHQQEFYKISNETLTEFERLCWKSYWLRSNLTPYVRRIKKNLKIMQQKESFKQSESTVFNIISNLQPRPWYGNIGSSLIGTLNNRNIKKQRQNLTPAYLNIKDTLDNSNIKTSALTFFRKLENKAEYDRLIYDRITDEITNVKSQLNVDGQNHARSYKSGRQKIEKSISKNLWAGSSLNKFAQNFMEPTIQPFSMFSVLTDSSIKPFGDLPTLRLLWACNKTNLFTYNENNFSRNLWSSYKIREQTKNNKTKKFISKMLKIYSLALRAKIPKNIDLISSTKTQLACRKINLFGGGAVIYGKNYNSYLRKLKYDLQTTRISNLQLSKKEKISVTPPPSDLPRATGEVLTGVGPCISKQVVNALPVKMGVADASFDLTNSQLFVNKKVSNDCVADLNLYNSNSNLKDSNFKFDKKNWFENNLGEKPQKRMIHFWWSTRQVNPLENICSFWMFSPLVFPSLDFYINENTHSSIPQDLILNSHNFTNSGLIQKNNSSKINLNQSLILTSFWICCILFHLSILFTVIRITEIRSLAKFQFLILSKLANTYLICLFSIYDLFKDYKTKINFLIKKAFKFSRKNSSSSLRSKLDLIELNGDLSSTSSTNRIKQKKFGLNYTQKFFKKSLYDNSNKIAFNLKNTNFSALKDNQLQNQIKASTPNYQKKGNTLIQSTIKLELNYRDFLNLALGRKWLTPLSKNSKKTHLNTENSYSAQNILNFMMLHSINPSVGSLKIRNKLQMLEKSSEKYWFYSWYTGFLWYTFSRPVRVAKTALKQNLRKIFQKIDQKTNFNSKKSFKDRKQNFSPIVLSNIQLQSILSLLTLSITKFSVNIFYLCFHMFYTFLFKLIDIIESILLIFYKFLEKPAELMVEWIAEIFLLEWSSDLITYVPEAFDTTMWTSVTKISRATRPFGGFIFGFLFQRIFLDSVLICYNWIFKPDTDLIIRQKKGIIFWDIWTEILIQAAETYKMNLSSLSTIKEEQELLIENLLEDKSLQLDKNNFSKTAVESATVSSNHFLNSFQTSLTKLAPLMRFLETTPINPSFNRVEFSKITPSKVTNNLFYPSQFFISEAQLYDWSSLKIQKQSSSNLFETNVFVDSWKKWSVSQYLTTQGRDTDLFMDIHPPKSFLHISFLKTYLPAQEILGSLVCEIFSGLFTQKVSKNVLVVGAPGAAKSFFIQALAGETELKIVTDNAHRYAIVQGGVPIGMKLLRDVFDSIALHTPCLFLLEDIHVIGERRPMLISDDENSKATDSTFGAEQEEVHEKNRLIYQLSRHSLSHYKRPYKGDFSLSIPTNHFCYDLFLGISPPRKRRSELTAKSPLPIIQLEKALTGIDKSNTNKDDSNYLDENKVSSFSVKQPLLSSLQISTEQIFAPPATSPFNILLMKEQKKLKPTKLVKELPWSGLSYDQFMLISKSHYSVRVKVALLAEMAMNNLSIKLDMITDLLVIIDSVRSNRGFVVFATTHMPSLLDPALRRPGRLDETLSLPLLPDLVSRFEIFKTNLSSYAETMDLLDYSLLTSKTKQNENQIYTSISKSLLLLLVVHTSQPASRNATKSIKNNNNKLMVNTSKFFNDYPIYSMSQAFQTSISLSSALINPSQLQNCLTRAFETQLINPGMTEISSKEKLIRNKISNILLAGNDKLNYISLTYSQAGQFLVESLLIHDQTTYSSKFLTNRAEIEETYNTEEHIYKTLYNSEIDSSHILLKLFAGKIAEFFVFSPKSIKSNDLLVSLSKNSEVHIKNTSISASCFSENLSLKKDWWLTQSPLLESINSPSSCLNFENIQNFQSYWQSATSFLDSFLQKRYLYKKNSIVSKMLLFEDNSSLREPPSPPNSSIFMPAKKFENYKRTLKDFIEKPMLTINEKIQIHQKQRFLKLLYNVPVKMSFQSISNSCSYLTTCFADSKSFHPRAIARVLTSTRSGVTNQVANAPEQNSKTTNFYNSFKELGYLDLFTLKPTSSYSVYKNRVLTRQRFSFLNQWWNGQLAEHNVETTYLSHVDWRSMFVQSLGDLVIDFPDADQYYNPRSRRWFLHSNSWGYWLSFEKNLTSEISQHYILNCFTKTSNLLNVNRELFDYMAYRFLRYHQLKEVDLLHVLIRFYKSNQC